MPLPPAPQHRASRLTQKAFADAAADNSEQPAGLEEPSSLAATSSTPSSKRGSGSRKAGGPSTAALVTRSKPEVFAAPTPSQVHTGPVSTDKPPSKTKARGTPKIQRRSGPRKLFVLDTNVLMHDPMSLFRFEEHDVFLPMIVLEELDGHKKGMTEVARNARQASRSLDALASAQGNDLSQGSPLSTTGHTDATGQLFFQTQALDLSLPLALPQGKADNQILGVVKALEKLQAPRQVVLVSKDINMRVKARALGLHAEDYQNDKTLEDGDLLYPGAMALPGDFWVKNGKTVESWQQGTHTFYRISGPIVPSLFMNQFVYFESPGEPSLYARVTEIRGKTVVLRTLRDFSHQKNAVWGVNTRNREQNFAMNLLTDPDIDFVTLAGTAGTGKTLMALAAGLTQVLDDRRYTEIIMTRATVSVGEDIGFLPGTEEEKMGPWMGALDDNLEFLAKGDGGNSGEWGRAATNELIKSRIKVKSMNFMRGRTFMNKYVIIDEAQNLTPKQMKTLITRAGPGTKIICMGNLAQIDTPYLTEGSSGLTYAVDRFKGWAHGGHITLARGERSRLADFASDVL